MFISFRASMWDHTVNKRVVLWRKHELCLLLCLQAWHYYLKSSCRWETNKTTWPLNWKLIKRFPIAFTNQILADVSCRLEIEWEKNVICGLWISQMGSFLAKIRAGDVTRHVRVFTAPRKWLVQRWIDNGPVSQSISCLYNRNRRLFKWKW